MKINNKVLAGVIFSLIILFSNASFSAISVLPTPTHVSVTENRGVIYITWKYDFDPGDSIYPPVDPGPSPFALSMAKSSQGALPALADCKFLCGVTSITPTFDSSSSDVKFEIQKSVPNSPFFTTLEPQWSSYTFKYPYQGDGPFKFRIRAVGVDHTTGKNAYSNYVETQSISRLNQVTIYPNGGAIDPTNRITLSSNGANVEYKFVTLNEACTDGNWSPYNSSLSISSPKRVCAKATKTGQIDSQISFADFNLRLNSPTISPTTSSINPDTLVTLSSSQGAALKYKLVALSQTCTDSGWQTYSAGFLLQSGKRVCAKASKPGWADSQLAYRDFNIVELSAFDSKTTTIPSDETFSERNAPQFDSVGFVTGNASVHGGAASYSIPLELPPGRAGVQPNLSLSYSSRSGNSTIGTGWAFSGGSSITRCGSTLAQDGYVQNPQYQSDDKLCLDGQRLIADMGDVYGQSGTVYYTEMDTFTRVTQSGSLNSSSASFTVEYKNGDIAYFGKTSSSRLVHQGKSTPYTWFIEYKHDSTAKNYINYKYQTFGAGEKLLTELNYTANSPSSSGIQSVQIEYEDKNNKSFGYISGGKYSSTKRIQRIDMLSGGNINTSYRLDYNSSVKTDNLEKIWKCFADYCLEPTSVTWSGEDDNFRLMPLGTDKTPFLIRDAQHLSLELPRGDANGDGVRDWKNKFINAEGEETGSFTANFEQCRETIFTGQLVCFSADFDQDGMSDEWEVVNNYLRITYSGGGSYYTNVFIPSDSVITGMKNRIVDIADYNGDSYPDLMVFTAQSSSNVKLTLYVHSKNKTTPYPQGQVVYNYPTTSTPRVGGSTRLTRSIEFNGDLTGNGLPDLIVTENEAVWNGQSYVQPIPDQILKNASTPSSIRFDSADLNLVTEKNYLNQVFSYFADVNGDSLPDWLGWESGDFVLRLNKGNGIFTASQSLGMPIVPSRTVQLVIKDEPYTRYQPIFTGAIKVFDIDNDGRMELLVPGRVAVEGCASGIMNNYKEETWCGSEIYSKTWSNSRGGYRRSVDARNKDDSLYEFDKYDFEFDESGTVSVRKENTDLIAHAYESTFIDVFGTGLQSFVFLNRKRPWTFHENNPYGYGVYVNRNYGVKSGTNNDDYLPTNLVTSITNGVGVENTWDYLPLSSGQGGLNENAPHYTLGSNYAAGYLNFTSSMYAVSNFKQSNGVGGFTEKKYSYLGAVYNLEGRGFMGFKSISEEDVNAGLVTQSDFEQIFPYQGKLTRQATFAKANYASHDLLNSENSETQALSFKEIEWQDNPNHSVAGVYSIYPKTTKIVTRLPSTSEGSSNSYSKTKVSTQTVTVNSIDKYGNVKEKVTQITDSWGVNKTTEVMSYDYDESSWFIDKLTAKTVTKHALTNRNSQDPITSTTELEPTTKVVTNLTNYHVNRKPRNITVSGLRGTSTSGKGTTTVTTYNDYGLPAQVSATAQVLNSSGSWVNQTRTTKMAYSKDGNTIAVDGYFPYELKNAKNHLSYTHVNPATGKVTKTRQQLSGSSYLTTEYTYDDYNRPFSSQTDGQPIVYTAVQFPDAQAPTNAVLQVVSVSAGQPTQKIYQDKLGRVLRTAVEDFNGDWVFTDVEYNDLGYKIFESIPYKEGSTAYGVSYTGFDILGRLTEKVTNQHCGDMTTNYAYAGLKTDITASEDCEGKTIDMSRTYNTLKQLMETVDANNGVTRYSYNTQGLPVVIQDANGNKIISKYNALGRKTQVNDPNQGVTNFEYNGFGELQREARVDSQTLTFITDVLGRVTRRTAEGEDTLNYTYDGAAYGLGQLNQATGNGVTKLFSFDSHGRAATQTIAGSGKTYKTTTFYDSNYGRVKGLRFPNNLTISYDYTNSGYLQSVKNTASEYVYKTVTEQDVFGNITEAELGNGTSETSTFSSRNGQMLLKAVAKGSNSLMNISYQSYDGFGNLKQVDVTTGNVGTDLHQFTETYDYDNLHRLERNYVDGYEVTSYSYDAIGNLLSKSDYATQYDYINGSTGGPNAVKRVYRNGWKSFGYDARGNMTSGDGLISAIYNAMDKPTQIKKAGKTLDFTYGPQHMRFKQVNGSVTTFYSDKLYEEEVNGSKTTWRAYVDDIAVISQTTNESATIRYTHKDRLGSARIFTDKNGYVTSQRNFDPFGKPRLASGSLMPYGNSKLNDLDKAKTRRGFTDHEHLDDVELIHMNGRVYDYNLGRFMSVDPVIQSPGNSQSINPYSYIMNNPLAGTDPTGYCSTGTHIDGEAAGCSVVFSDGSLSVGQKAENYASASLANSGATVGVSQLVSNGIDKTISTAGTKLNNMDIGSTPTIAEADIHTSQGGCGGALSASVAVCGVLPPPPITGMSDVTGQADRNKRMADGVDNVLDAYSDAQQAKKQLLLAAISYMRNGGLSEKLRKELESINQEKPGDGYEAHHIIPRNGFKNLDGGIITEGMRQLLQQHGIGIDSATNLIWLPKNESARIAGDRSVAHGVGHRHQTLRAVNQRIQLGAAVGGKNGIITALESIKNDFRNGVIYE